MDITQFATIALEQLKSNVPLSRFDGKEKFEMTVGSSDTVIKIFYRRGLWGAAYMESQEYLPYYHVSNSLEEAIGKANAEMSYEDKEPTMTTSLFLELLSENPNMNMI